MKRQKRKLNAGAPEQLLSEKDVVKIVNKSRATLRRWVKSGDFPAPVKAGDYSILWKQSEVENWMESLPRVDW